MSMNVWSGPVNSFSLTFNLGPEPSDQIGRVYPGNNMTGG